LSTFRQLFHLSKIGQKQQKGKAITFTFRQFLATYFIFESKAIAYTFRPLLATYFIFEKEAKNSKILRL
jgi:hypothetical protein